jgi:hypothetical protein
MAKYKARMARIARMITWKPAGADETMVVLIEDTCMSIHKVDTDSNAGGTADDTATPAGMHPPAHGPHDAIGICNTDDLRREKALRESSLRVPR